jgi:hypothetical protein
MDGGVHTVIDSATYHLMDERRWKLTGAVLLDLGRTVLGPGAPVTGSQAQDEQRAVRLETFDSEGLGRTLSWESD